jgi:hypothetical protein
MFVRPSSGALPFSMNDLIVGRRPVATALNAAVRVSPSASRSAIALASVPVRSSPSRRAAPALVLQG